MLRDKIFIPDESTFINCPFFMSAVEAGFPFRITGQNFEIFEIRPRWDEPSIKLEIPVAKATYVKKTKIWKLYWKRADMKWHRYKLFEDSESLEEVLEAIDQDEYGCFWG